MSEQNINDGGPYVSGGQLGAGYLQFSEQKPMTMRDYFAAAALPVAWSAYEAFDINGENPNEEIAKAAYQLADAMLDRRKR